MSVCTNSRTFPTIAVSCRFGAVKEQNRAMRMVECGFVELPTVPLFTGECGGDSRRTVSLDISTEDLIANVDFLSKLDNWLLR